MMKSSLIQLYFALYRLYRRLIPISERNWLFVLGFPRGGTTWIAEVLTSKAGTLLVYEPLGSYLPGLKETDYRRFESSETVPVQVGEYLLGHMSGERAEPEFFFRNDVRNLFKGKRKLAKLIKGMPLVFWLCGWVDPARMVVIFRHPCAVVVSQMKFDPGAEKQFFHHDLFEAEVDEIVEVTIKGKTVALRNMIEKLAYTYAVGAQDALEALYHYPTLNLVVYEEFVLDPLSHFQHLKKTLEFPFELDETSFKKPSRTVRNDSPVKSGEEQLAKWKKALTKEDQDSIKRILSYFELEDLYLDDQTFNRNLIKPNNEH